MHRLSALLLTATLLFASAAEALTAQQRILLLGNPRASTTKYAPAWWDDFSGTAANLNAGRTKNGYSWTVNGGGTGVTNGQQTTISANGLGRLGISGSGTNNGHAYISLPITTNYWDYRRTAGENAGTWAFQATSSGAYQASQILYDGSNTWDSFRLTFSKTSFPTLSAMAFTYGKGVSGTAVTGNFANVSNVVGVPGDNMEVRSTFDAGSGTVLASLYINGQRVKSGLNTSVANIAYNGNYGVLETNPATSLRYIEVGNPDTQAMIRLYAPSRVVNTDTNGDLTYYFRGDYSQVSLRSVTYSIFDASTDVAVTGASNVTVNSLSTTAGTWSATANKVLAANVPASFYVQVCRADINVGGTPMCSWGPVQRAGPVVATNGQSLIAQQWAASSGITVALPAQAWMTDGSQGASGSTNEDDSRVKPMLVNTPNAYWASTINTATGGSNFNLIRGGLGGTTAWERLPNGTTSGSPNHIYDQLLTGIFRAGTDIREMVDSSGTYDAQSTAGNGSVADFTANLNTIYSTLESDLRRPANGLPVQLVILGAVKGGATDANQQAIRRQLVVLANSGGRYYRGPDTYHLQHNSTDNYHLINPAYAEQARLTALAELNHWLGGTTYKRGPTLNSVSVISATAVDVLYDCPNCASMGVLNPTGTGITNGYDGAMQFANSAANIVARTLVHAGAVSCDAPASSQVTCHYTGFPALTFLLKAYVAGPYGINPGNPANNATAENAGGTTNPTAIGKNWTYGAYTGEENVPVQSYFNTVTGNDYVVSP